jgi:hypothetical protein
MKPLQRAAHGAIFLERPLSGAAAITKTIQSKNQAT